MSTPRDMLIAAVHAMGPELKDISVFIGGCTVFLYLDDENSDEVRATEDVDVIVEVTSRLGWYDLEQKIIDAGFSHSLTEDDPTCRFRNGSIIVDFMPTDNDVLGFTNQWYAIAYRKAIAVPLNDRENIKLASIEYFLATKLAAYFGRGNNDLIASKDAEDLFRVIGGRRDLLAESQHFSAEVKSYVGESLETMKKDPNFSYALEGNFSPAIAQKISAMINNLILYSKL